MQNLKEPSGFFTKSVGTAQTSLLGRMNPFANKSSIVSFWSCNRCGGVRQNLGGVVGSGSARSIVTSSPSPRYSGSVCAFFLLKNPSRCRNCGGSLSRTAPTCSGSSLAGKEMLAVKVEAYAVERSATTASSCDLGAERSPIGGLRITGLQWGLLEMSYRLQDASNILFRRSASSWCSGLITLGLGSSPIDRLYCARGTFSGGQSSLRRRGERSTLLVTNQYSPMIMSCFMGVISRVSLRKERLSTVRWASLLNEIGSFFAPE